MSTESLQYVEVGNEGDLAEGAMQAVQVDGKRVLLTMVEGRAYAIGAICTHERSNLDEGTLMGYDVYCPLHFSCFDVRTGEALAPPADRPTPVYAVKVEDGKVLVSTTAVDPEVLDEDEDEEEEAVQAEPEASAPAPAEPAPAEAAEPAPAEAAAEPAPAEAAAEPAPAEAAAEPAPAEAAAEPTRAESPAEPAPAEAAPAAPEPAAPPEREAEPAVAVVAATGVTSVHTWLFHRIEDIDWLESASEWLGTALRPARESPSGRQVFDLLHGRVMGHALHPALSDLPIGLGAGAVLLDAAGEDHAAGILGAGIVASSVAAAATGVADWTVSDGRDRRVGLLHGILQTAGLALQVGSLGLRLGGARKPAKALLAAGVGVTAGSAYLGGHLVLGRGVMVDHTAWMKGPRRWTRAVALDDLGEGTAKAADVEGRQVLVSRIDGTISAIENTCSHQGGPLSMGKIADGVVTCPWHGSCFRLRDGAVVRGPSAHPQPMLEARVRKGWVEVRARRH
jgi:nitrite reductase/ring-hydroxylating ferredoxin subunit